jgi:hypothetical protein
MARKSRFRFEQTMSEVQGMFVQIDGANGRKYNVENERRLMALKIDHEPIGDRQAERRKPDSIFYAQEFVEGMSVARILVLMDLDATAVNIHRRDAPDVRVDFSDREPIFFEHSSVTAYDGMQFARHLDEINVAVRARLAADSTARSTSEAGWASVQLTDPGVGRRAKAAEIAAELTAFITPLSGSVDGHRADGNAFPLLARYHAIGSYRPGPSSNPLICGPDAAWIDPTHPWLAGRIRNALSKKAEDACGYSPADRPLWLLLTFEVDRLLPRFVPDLVSAALAGVDVAPFDGVVVWHVGCAPMVFEPRRPN